jgi:hypothetical protein
MQLFKRIALTFWYSFWLFLGTFFSGAFLMFGSNEVGLTKPLDNLFLVPFASCALLYSFGLVPILLFKGLAKDRVGKKNGLFYITSLEKLYLKLFLVGIIFWALFWINIGSRIT